ncbi:hypothetical protein GW930_03005 [Candidatus Saccharibacteria bacterium]|nr:hypothetical protein [Candidatus Saccharibacteria bacterium]
MYATDGVLTVHVARELWRELKSLPSGDETYLLVKMMRSVPGGQEPDFFDVELRPEGSLKKATILLGNGHRFVQCKARDGRSLHILIGSTKKGANEQCAVVFKTP